MCDHLKNPFDKYVNYNPCDTNHFSQENFTAGLFYRVTYKGQFVGILAATDMFIFKSKVQSSKTV